MTESETRNHILTIVSSLIAEQGFANTSMNDIVNATGLSKGGIYWHFKSKDDIIFSIIERIFTEQMNFIDEVLTSEGTASERFTHLLNLIRESLDQSANPIPSPIEIYAEALRKPYLLAHIKRYFERYQAALADLLREGTTAGDFTVDDADHTAFVFMSSVEGIILMNTINGSPHNISDSFTHTMNIFRRGIQHKGN